MCCVNSLNAKKYFSWSYKTVLNEWKLICWLFFLLLPLLITKIKKFHSNIIINRYNCDIYKNQKQILINRRKTEFEIQFSSTIPPVDRKLIVMYLIEFEKKKTIFVNIMFFFK